MRAALETTVQRRSFRELLPWTRGQDPSSYPSTFLFAAEVQGSLLGLFMEDEGEGERN